MSGPDQETEGSTQCSVASFHLYQPPFNVPHGKSALFQGNHIYNEMPSPVAKRLCPTPAGLDAAGVFSYMESDSKWVKGTMVDSISKQLDERDKRGQAELMAERCKAEMVMEKYKAETTIKQYKTDAELERNKTLLIAEQTKAEKVNLELIKLKADLHSLQQGQDAKLPELKERISTLEEDLAEKDGLLNASREGVELFQNLLITEQANLKEAKNANTKLKDDLLGAQQELTTTQDKMTNAHAQIMAAKDSDHNAALEAKEKEHRAAREAKEREHDLVLEAKNKEHRAALEAKEKEHAMALEAKNKEHRAALEAKEKEHDVVLKAKDKDRSVMLGAKNEELRIGLLAKDRAYNAALQAKEQEHRERLDIGQGYMEERCKGFQEQVDSLVRELAVVKEGQAKVRTTFSFAYIGPRFDPAEFNVLLNHVTNVFKAEGTIVETGETMMQYCQIWLTGRARVQLIENILDVYFSRDATDASGYRSLAIREQSALWNFAQRMIVEGRTSGKVWTWVLPLSAQPSAS